MEKWKKSSSFIQWVEKYKNNEIIDLKKYLSAEDFEIIKKLGIEIKNKIYTEYEFELLNMELLAYYDDFKNNSNVLNDNKKLENIGISQEQYNKLINKIFKINKFYML